MKLLKLEVNYNNCSALREYMIIPSELNGVLFETLPIEKVMKEAVYLHNINLMFNQFYGDLLITEIDSTDLNKRELENLIYNSCSDSFRFFFLKVENDFLKSNLVDKEERENCLNKYGLLNQDLNYYSIKIHDSLVDNFKLKNKKRANISIYEDDLDKVLKLLKEHSIKII